MGVEIMGANGEMRALHDIAKDAQVAFGDVSGTEQLTAMLEDMNVRGATAFALLVQNADEFGNAVDNLANSAGEATAMADVQQQSLAMQIQRVKNALLAPFLFADEVGAANDTLNEFTFHIQNLVNEFVGFFIHDLPDGTQKLTENAQVIKEFVIVALQEAIIIIRQLKSVFLEGGEGMETMTTLLQLSLKPLKIMLNILDRLGPKFLQYVIQFKVLNSLLPITNALGMIGTLVQMKYMASLINTDVAMQKSNFTMVLFNNHLAGQTGLLYNSRLGFLLYRMGLLETHAATGALQMSTMGLMVTMGASIGLMAAAVAMTGPLADGLGALAGAMFALSLVTGLRKAFEYPPPISWAMWATTAAIGAGAGIMIRKAAKSTFAGMFDVPEIGDVGTGMSVAKQERDYSTPIYDSGGMFTGGRMYDMGGPTTEHGMAILQKGETVIPKTQNMLESGITLNIGGDIVTDNAEDFAERIAEVLPQALRRQNDIGGI